MNRILIVFFLLLICFQGRAQVSIKDSTISFSMISATGSYQVPGGDIADRFGNNFTVGGSLLFKSKSNWLVAIDGNFIFGGEVRENTILSGISTQQGYVIGVNGQYADIFLHERGYTFIARAGKIFPVMGPNSNSGLTATIGAGFLQHKILIEDKGNKAAPLETEYKKGYDRLTNGWCLSQFVGYTNFSNSRLVNFYAGIEVVEAFTQNRRSVNFDTMMKDETKRLDIFYGLKFGWIIPFYKRVPKEYYYN